MALVVAASACGGGGSKAATWPPTSVFQAQANHFCDAVNQWQQAGSTNPIGSPAIQTAINNVSQAAKTANINMMDLNSGGPPSSTMPSSDQPYRAPVEEWGTVYADILNLQNGGGNEDPTTFSSDEQTLASDCTTAGFPVTIGGNG